MPKRTLAKQIDAFELELNLVETFIAELTEIPHQDIGARKRVAQLDRHRLRMRKQYDFIRPELFRRLH